MTDDLDPSAASPEPNGFRRLTDAVLSRLRVRFAPPTVRLPRPDLRALGARIAAYVTALPPRRQAMLGVGVVGGLVAVVAVGFIGVSVVSALSAQFGYHPAEQAKVWASLKPRYAIATTCANCHAREGVKLMASKHAVVPCQSCHGPLEGHDASGMVSAAALNALQTRALCEACHAQAQGRPPKIAQIDVNAHFTPGACAQCHDPHTTSPVHPPKIPHPLDKLPDCSVCHGSSGLRPVPPSHPIFPSDLCRKCHDLLPAEQLRPVS